MYYANWTGWLSDRNHPIGLRVGRQRIGCDLLREVRGQPGAVTTKCEKKLLTPIFYEKNRLVYIYMYVYLQEFVK